MEQVITTYGGGELYWQVFNGIAALFNSKSGFVNPMIRLALMVGAFYVVILMFVKNDLMEGVKWFLWVLIATQLIFLPKTTVYIHDPLAKTKQKVDNVPFALGVFASTVSGVGRVITEKFESVFTLPDYLPYHKTGTVFASSLMSQLYQFRIVDPEFRSNMERFVNQCVVYDVMIGHKYGLKDLQNTSDIWDLVSSKASPILGFLYREGDAEGEIVTCRIGAKLLGDKWNEEISRAAALYGGRVNNQTLTETSFLSHLQSSYMLLTGIAENAKSLLKQEMMVHAIEEGANNKLSELGSSQNYASTKALLQQRSTYAIAGNIAAKTLPLFKNVIEAISFALFIFIVVLALLPGGHKALLTYFGILVWTQLWAPLYAVLNLIMTLYGKSETMAFAGKEGLTLLNSSAIMNVNADMMTLAAWLAVSIPFISYGILKQGAGAFVGLAHHLGSAMQSAASSVAQETVSGNLSLSNVSVGTQAYQNTSAFQHNTSPSHQSSQFKAVLPSGMEQTTLADGTQVYQAGQAISHMGTQIMASENASIAKQESLNHAKSLMQQKSLAAGEATEAALGQTANLMKRISSDQTSREDYSHNVSASEAQSLQNFQNYVQDIRQQTGLTENQAIEAAVGASVGSPAFLGISASGSGSFSSSTARQQAIERAEGVATQSGYHENFDQVVSASKSLSEGRGDTVGAELAGSVSSSISQAKSLREEASIAQSHVSTLSQEVSANQNKGFSLTKDISQEILDYVAHQPVNSGPGSSFQESLGYEGARQIMDRGGGEFASYLGSFQEKHPQYVIEGVTSQNASSDFTVQYENQKQKITNDIAQTGQKSAQMVLAKASRAGLDPAKNQSLRPKQMVQNQMRSVDKKMQKQKKEINKKGQLLKEREKASEDKNMTTSAIKNVFKNLTGN